MTMTLPPSGPQVVDPTPAVAAADMSVMFSLAAVERRQRRAPNLLIAGVSSAGAEGLTQALGRHPYVGLPAHKVHRYTPLRYGRSVDTALADYDRAFATSTDVSTDISTGPTGSTGSTAAGHRYRLESSPGYFDGGRALVETVHRELPGLRVIIVLRDPAERLWASYTDKLARRRLPEGSSYESFVERCLALRANGCDRFESNRYFRTLASGHYADHLATWLDVFGRRLRLTFAEHLELDPANGVARLYDWLDLEPAQAGSGRDSRTAAGSPSMITMGDAEGLESFRDQVVRRSWPALTRPAGTWSPTEMASGLRRAARPFLPRQGDRVRARVEAMYARPNRELATLLREHGVRDLPRWLASA